MRIVQKNCWFVMSGQEGFGPRCYETNATGIATLEEAEQIAAERNAAEKLTGHKTVLWYPMQEFEVLP